MRFSVLGVFASLALTLPLRAATIRVPADYPTIQAAVDAAATSDTVLVAAGTYVGSPGSTACVVVDKAIHLVSESGADFTTIDGEGVRRVLSATGTGPKTVRGFTIRNGAAANGAGFYVNGIHSACTVEENVFESNHATGSGGALYVLDYASFHVYDNTFRDNSGNGAAVYTDANPLDFVSNVVKEDTPGYAISGVLWYADCYLTDSVIANSGGGAIYLQAQCAPGPDIQRCTITGSPRAIYLDGELDSRFVETLVVGPVVHYFYFFECGGSDRFTHVDLYGGFTVLGDPWDIDIIWDQPNLDADPLFCGRENYTLAASSPCLPQNNPWGVRIGARGEGCELPTALRQESWGSIKARYR